MKTVSRRPANHALHLVLTLATCGLWLPVWAVSAVVGRRETVTVEDPEAYGGPWSYCPPGVWTANQNVIEHGGAVWRWNPYANRWERTL